MWSSGPTSCASAHARFSQYQMLRLLATLVLIMSSNSSQAQPPAQRSRRSTRSSAEGHENVTIWYFGGWIDKTDASISAPRRSKLHRIAIELGAAWCRAVRMGQVTIQQFLAKWHMTGWRRCVDTTIRKKSAPSPLVFQALLSHILSCL